MAEFLELAKTKAESENSWLVDVADLDQESFDLSVKNPNAPEEEKLPEPAEILATIEELDKESREILEEVKRLI